MRDAACSGTRSLMRKSQCEFASLPPGIKAPHGSEWGRKGGVISVKSHVVGRRVSAPTLKAPQIFFLIFPTCSENEERI